MAYELFEHGADVGVRGTGRSPAEAFEGAATALTAILLDPGVVEAVEAVEIACEAPDLDLLLVDWLNALIYEMATRGLVFGRYEVEIAGGTLRGTAWGEKVDRTRHELAAEPKGATYTEARVAEGPDGTWTAQCIIDV